MWPVSPAVKESETLSSSFGDGYQLTESPRNISVAYKFGLKVTDLTFDLTCTLMIVRDWPGVCLSLASGACVAGVGGGGDEGLSPPPLASLGNWREGGGFTPRGGGVGHHGLNAPPPPLPLANSPTRRLAGSPTRRRVRRDGESAS